MNIQKERWLWRAGALLVSVAVLGGLSEQWSLLSGSITGSPAAERDASCLPGRQVPVMDSPHVSAEQLTAVDYNSLPPTSGPHFSFTIAPGIYSDPVPEGLTVHAMEHGHVVIQYAPDTPRDTVTRLERLAKRYARDVVLAPYAKLDQGIALTAWGRIDVMTGYDGPRATAFVERLRHRYHHGWARSEDCPAHT